MVVLEQLIWYLATPIHPPIGLFCFEISFKKPNPPNQNFPLQLALFLSCIHILSLTRLRAEWGENWRLTKLCLMKHMKNSGIGGSLVITITCFLFLPQFAGCSPSYKTWSWRGFQGQRRIHGSCPCIGWSAPKFSWCCSGYAGRLKHNDTP